MPLCDVADLIIVSLPCVKKRLISQKPKVACWKFDDSNVFGVKGIKETLILILILLLLLFSTSKLNLTGSF